MFLHIASFRGKQNWDKVRVLVLLYVAERQGIASLTTRLIVFNTDISPDYLYHRLPLWVKWRYLKRSDSPDGFRYSLAPRGERFIERIVPAQVLARAFNSIGVKE